MQVEAARWAVSQEFLRNFNQRMGESVTTTPEMARVFTESLLDGARSTLSEEPRRRRAHEWSENPETRAALEKALDERREARRAFQGTRSAASWKAIKEACKAVKAAIAEGIYAHLDRYVTELEAIYKARDMRGCTNSSRDQWASAAGRREDSSSSPTRMARCSGTRRTSSSGG